MPASRTSLDLRIEIADMYDSGRYVGRCTAEDIANRLQSRKGSVGAGLKALGFKKVARQKRVREKGSKRVTHIPAEWEPPKDWPEIFSMQRQLRKGGVSAAATLRATDAACGEADILESAIGSLLLQDIPVRKRGALKAKIKEVIREERHEYKTRSILLVELAERLRESPFISKEGLLNRVSAFLNKEKLCMNILTLGGTGLNQHVNIVAFQQALAEYGENLRQKDQAQANARLNDAIKERDRYRDLLADAEARAREATDDARDKERKLNAAERSVLRYELTGAAAAA